MRKMFSMGNEEHVSGKKVQKPRLCDRASERYLAEDQLT